MPSASAASRPVAGSGAVAGVPGRDLVCELADVLERALALYVDVDVGFASLEERVLLDRAAEVLERARREGGKP